MAIKEGEPGTGFPITRKGDVIPGPDDSYNPDDSPERCHKPACTSNHRTLTFLRLQSLLTAVLALKNRGMSPVRVRAKDSPTKKDWDNVATTLHCLHHHYCAAEGLARTSDHARKILLYMFFGQYWKKDKKGKFRRTPVLRALHYMLTEGRHRFASRIPVYFDGLLNYLAANEQAKLFLDDKGEDKDVPVEYLALVEKGLRAFAQNIFAMGANAMRSRWDWQHVDTWRKTECYIALVRHVKGMRNYKQWDCYRWEDYTHRLECATTFYVRHLPLSKATKKDKPFGSYLQDPKDWDQPTIVFPRRKRKTSGRSTNPKRTAKSDTVMVFNVHTGKLEPLLDAKWPADGEWA